MDSNHQIKYSVHRLTRVCGGLQIITGGLQFGAGVGLTELKDTLEGQSEQEAYAAIASTLRAVANTNVRNVATWAGNIMLHKLHGDSLTLLPLITGAWCCDESKGTQDKDFSYSYRASAQRSRLIRVCVYALLNVDCTSLY